MNSIRSGSTNSSSVNSLTTRQRWSTYLTIVLTTAALAALQCRERNAPV